jgi:hypothetical protein
MNAVYLLLPRLLQGKRWGKETLAGGGLDNRQFNDFAKEGPLTQFFEAPGTVWTPRVLKDGSDSVGALGAQPRFTTSARSAKSGCSISTPSSAASGCRRSRRCLRKNSA